MNCPEGYVKASCVVLCQASGIRSSGSIPRCLVTGPTCAYLWVCSALLFPLTMVDLVRRSMLSLDAADAVIWLYTTRDWTAKHL